MAAVSTISTMNVERPRARSSEAPTRVNRRSTTPMAADRAGTYEPICASTAISAFWRRKVDLPAMLGPVTSQMRAVRQSRRSPDAGASLGAPQHAIVLDEGAGLAPPSSACSTTGWRPPRISKASLVVDDGPHVALDARKLGQRRRRDRARPAPRRRRREPRSSRCDGRASSANTSCSRLSARSVAEAMRPSVSMQLRRREAHGVRHRLAVAERRPTSGASSSGLAFACVDLDVEAEDVVVAHLQRLDAGRLDVSALRARPSRRGCRPSGGAPRRARR